MDYLKFLLITVLSSVVIAFVAQLHLGISFIFGIAIAVFLVLARLKKEDLAVAYFIWIILCLLTYDFASIEVPKYVSEHPEMKSSPAAFKGLYILILMIIAHPMSYGLGKLIFFFGKKFKQINQSKKAS